MQTVARKTLEDKMYFENTFVFDYKISYPSFRTSCDVSAAQIINDYYFSAAKSAEDYCRNILFNQAVNDLKYSQEGQPANSYTFVSSYKITYNAQCIVSLYTDTYTYMGGAHGETKRTSDTWNFNTGTRIKLNDIYPLFPSSLFQLQNCINQQIEERLSANPGSFFDDFRVLSRSAFDENNFYLESCHGVIYYQQYDVAPYSTGIPEFNFPLCAASHLLC